MNLSSLAEHPRAGAIAIATTVLAACALVAPSARAAGTLTVKATGAGTVSASGILCPPTCKQRYPRPSHYLIGFGHSEATSFGATTPTQAWPALLAHDIPATEDNQAVIGAVTSYPDGTKYQGGWAWVLQNANPGTNMTALPFTFTSTLFYGFNDLNDLGGPSNLSPFVQALQTIISRVDSIAVFEDNDPTVSAPSSAWASITTSGVNSGTTVLAPKASGVPLTISVPADFQGGTIALGFSATSTTNPPAGQAIYSISVDGGAPRPYTIDAPSMVTPYIGFGGGWIGTVYRIPNLAPGPHTIKLALDASAATIGSYFDYWEALANPPVARPIELPLQFAIPPNGFIPFIGDPYIPNNPAIASLDQDIRQVAAQFGPNVMPVQLNLGTNPANLTSDGSHPNDAGHALIAQQLFAALTMVTLTETPKRGARFKGWQGACSGTGPCTVTVSRNRSVTATFSHH